MNENDKISVNDGDGLLDNIGMIDSLIVDCNNIPALLLQGKYVAFCSHIVQMVQKLALLKKGVQDDTESLKNKVDELNKYINEGEYTDVQR